MDAIIIKNNQGGGKWETMKYFILPIDQERKKGQLCDNLNYMPYINYDNMS